jgi:predicted  nucleic acid-binding Zn-ribbon protein
LKLSESDLERVRYDMEGTRIKSQNLEKELKELKQQIFKTKVGEHKEERRIFRGKLD